MIEYRVSTFCDAGGCVEVGEAPDGTWVVRDTKDAARSAALRFTAEEWAAFVQGVKAGEFDPRG